jgi:hypothetical protein
MPANLSTEAEIAAVAGRLSAAQVEILLDAEPADSFEWWLHEDVGDRRLAGSDLVLTDLGHQVRAHILEEERRRG